MALTFNSTISPNYVFLFDGQTIFRPLHVSCIVINTSEKNGTFQLISQFGQVLYENQWSNIDWKNCVPPMEGDNTRNNQIQYLCSKFSGR